jgi:hypothetical protein
MEHQQPPKLVALDPDDYHARNVGLTAAGMQFFLTNPFVPKAGSNEGREFLALYLFHADGAVAEAFIDDLGPRGSLSLEQCSVRLEQRLEQIGPVRHQRIVVQPFEIERFGVTFGFVTRDPEDEEDVWCVEVQPGNYMAFFEPFDSGEYDT